MSVGRPGRLRLPALILLAAGLAGAASGCALFDTDAADVPGMFESDPEFTTPELMIPLWTDTVLHTAGKPPIRGCGGRIMFYTEEGKEAVRVDGTLKVYVWNDSAPVRQRQPDREYVFRADQLQKHYSRSRVGHSYSFWLPWGPAGGDRVELTVVARFVGRDGSDISTTPSRVILPGRIPMPEPPDRRQNTRRSKIDESAADDSQAGEHSGSPATEQRQPIRQTSYERPAESAQRADESVSSLRTTEIPLTPGFVERNQRLPKRVLSADDLFGELTSDSDSAFDPAEPVPETADGDGDGPFDADESVSDTTGLQNEASEDRPAGSSEFQEADRPGAEKSGEALSGELPEESLSRNATTPLSARSLRDRFRAQRARSARRFAAAPLMPPSP